MKDLFDHLVWRWPERYPDRLTAKHELFASMMGRGPEALTRELEKPTVEVVAVTPEVGPIFKWHPLPTWKLVDVDLAAIEERIFRRMLRPRDLLARVLQGGDEL